MAVALEGEIIVGNPIQWLSTAAGSEALFKAKRKAATALKNEVKKTTRFVDRSGNLRRSFAVRSSKKLGSASVVARSGGTSPTTRGFHSVFVERGHGGPRPAPGRFYFYHAFKDNEQKLHNIMIKEVESEMTAAARKQYGRNKSKFTTKINLRG